jgi:hypothetical protein
MEHSSLMDLRLMVHSILLYYILGQRLLQLKVKKVHSIHYFVAQEEKVRNNCLIDQGEKVHKILYYILLQGVVGLRQKVYSSYWILQQMVHKILQYYIEDS